MNKIIACYKSKRLHLFIAYYFTLDSDWNKKSHMMKIYAKDIYDAFNQWKQSAPCKNAKLDYIDKIVANIPYERFFKCWNTIYSSKIPGLFYK